MEPRNLSTKANADWRAIDDFRQSVAQFGDRPALRANGVNLTYGALDDRAQAIATAIHAARKPNEVAVAALYADRGSDCYAGVLATQMLGYTYVPLNPKFPAARNRLILDRSRASVVMCARAAAAAVSEILAVEGSGPPPRLLICDDVPAARLPTEAQGRDNPYVYTLFTSGSTGQPKGVSIRHSNLGAYLDAVGQVADYGPHDRLSQTFDLTFDLSAHDMFVCWGAGAELVVPSTDDLERPADFVANNAITCWFSVPSLAQKMRMQKDVTPAKLGSLRLSLFCGEALRIDLAQDWAAATGQRVENWYGPTEATIACTRFVVPPAPAVIDGQFGLVPIGEPLPGMQALILDEAGQRADMGELLVSGAQVADGYLNDTAKTDAAFVHPAGFDGRYYRTGDRVHQLPSGQINFIDRLDNQIKIRGYRVELGEIEAVMRALIDGHQAVVIPLPVKSPTPTALVGVVEAWEGVKPELMAKMAGRLPDYMLPTRIISVKVFPKNASGKVDRGQLAERVMKRLGIVPDEVGATAAPVKAGGKAGGKLRQGGAAGPAKGKKAARLNAAKAAAPTPVPTSAPDQIAAPGEINAGILGLIRAINPTITRPMLLQADNLMNAGLDSLGFVELTMKLEQKFGLTLDQTIVAEMSEMSLIQLRQYIRKHQPQAKATGAKPAPASAKFAGKPHYRAMRTIDLLDKLPGFVRETTKPLVMCLGSSGFMRGIAPPAIEAAMGHTVRAANLGMGKLSALGITELSEYLRDILKSENRRIAHAVIELEVMQLTFLPAAGDIEVVPQYLAGEFTDVTRTYYDANTTWDSASGGLIEADPEVQRPTREADWERRRSLEVRGAFEGQLEFDETQVAIWLRGVAALREVSDNVLAVIHPLIADDIAERRATVSPNRLTDLLARVTGAEGVPVMLDTDFTLERDDFSNLNHMNTYRGRDKFSAQIAARLLAGNR